MTTTLSKNDAGRVLDLVPGEIIRAMQDRESALFLAGGCIRAVLNKEPINDFDLFTDTAEMAATIARNLDSNGMKTKSAYTIKKFNPAVQIIHRQFFRSPEEVINSFDFTICRAVIWWEEGDWYSLADERFAPDVKEKVLRYCEPGNNRAPDSLVRAFKFSEKGYHLLPSSLAKLVIRSSEDCGYKELCAAFSGSDDPAQWEATIKNCGSSR